MCNCFRVRQATSFKAYAMGRICWSLEQFFLTEGQNKSVCTVEQKKFHMRFKKNKMCLFMK